MELRKGSAAHLVQESNKRDVALPKDFGQDDGVRHGSRPRGSVKEEAHVVAAQPDRRKLRLCGGGLDAAMVVQAMPEVAKM